MILPSPAIVSWSFIVSRCIGTWVTNSMPLSALAPSRAKYSEYKRSLCDGCISLSYAEGLEQTSFLWNFRKYFHATDTFSASTSAILLRNIWQERGTHLLITPKKNLPSEAVRHSTLIQIFQPSFFLFFLCWCGLIF